MKRIWIIGIAWVLIGSSCATRSDGQYDETVRTMGNIELHFVCLTEWASCHAYGVEAYRRTWWGKREKAYLFEYIPEVALFLNEPVQDDKLSAVGVEIYGITPEILLDEWAESFFFDRTKEDIYLPVLDEPKVPTETHLVDHDHWDLRFYHYHWNGSYFAYRGIVIFPLSA